MKTTTDVQKKAYHIMALAKVVTNPERRKRLEIERQDVLRIANKALETGGFEKQARQELLAARYMLGTGFNEAQKQNAANERAASFKQLIK